MFWCIWGQEPILDWTLWHRWGQGSRPRQRVGSELQCGRGQKWRRHRESKLRCAGETWAVAHVRFVFSNFVLNGFEFSPWAMGHEVIFAAQQFGAIHCYLHLARFHIHPLLWSLRVFSTELLSSCFLKAELFGRISDQASCFFTMLHTIFVLVMVS